MQGHTEKLMKLCRLYCVKIKNIENRYSFPKEIKNYKIEVMKLFNYDITSDKEGIHAIYVCDACRRKLDRCCNSEVESTMMAKFYGHDPENCMACSHKVKKHNFSVKIKVPAGFSNRKQELVTMEKLTFDLIIQKFTLYDRILIKKSADRKTVARVIENENESITNSLT